MLNHTPRSRTPVWHGLSLPLCLLLAFTPPAAVRAGEQETKAQLQNLGHKIGGLRQQLKTQRASRKQTATRLRKAELRLGALRRQLRDIETGLAHKSGLLKVLRRRLTKQQHKLRQLRHTLADQLRAAYATGREDYLKVILNQEDPHALARVMTYYQYFSRARAAQIVELQQQLQQLTETEITIRLEKAALAHLQTRKTLSRAEVQTQRRERRLILGRMDKGIRDDNAQLRQLLHNKKQLEKLLHELGQKLSDIPKQFDNNARFSLLKGRLPWPTRGRLVQRFGTLSSSGNLSRQGVKIAAPRGETVSSIFRGRVAFADWLRGFGLLLIIDHGNGFMSLYGHNESLLKEAGDWVDQGETVASVGDSGGQAKNGLYFAIRRNGKPVNPQKWCRKGRPLASLTKTARQR